MPASWPGSLPHMPLAGSQQVDPFRAPLETEMEDGNVRRRRSTTKNVATVPLTLRMTNGQFDTFKAWVRDTLVDGTLSFTMPIWVGSDYRDRLCTMRGRYKADAAGGFFHDVGMTLDVEDY